MSSQGTALDIALVRANDLTFTATATTSAHGEGATMTTARQADEIDALRS